MVFLKDTVFQHETCRWKHWFHSPAIKTHKSQAFVSKPFNSHMLTFEVQWETFPLIAPAVKDEEVQKSCSEASSEAEGFRERWSKGNEYRLWGKFATWPRDKNHRAKLYHTAQRVDSPSLPPPSHSSFASYTHFCGQFLSSLCPLIHQAHCNVHVHSSSHENSSNTAGRKIHL